MPPSFVLRARRVPVTFALCAALVAACGSGSSGGASDPVARGTPTSRPGAGGRSGFAAPGDELEKPGGGTFFLDPHQGGSAATLHLAETFWGRLVDVYDTDAAGVENPEPRFRDLVIRSNVVSDGLNYTLTTGASTLRTRLVVHAKKGSERFGALLRAATSGLIPVIPKNDDGTSAPPFSLVPRNACLVARFDDCLEDGASAAQDLLETVQVVTGYPPHTPFGARPLFDPNHGGLVNGAFHSTRVLVDLTVSELEAAEMPVPQPINVAGLPASRVDLTSPNVTLVIPTQKDPGIGQFTLLRNLAGTALAPNGNGPIHGASPTRDVVRAMRSGNATDESNGFLIDLEAPQVLGDFPVVVQRAVAAGGPDWLVDLSFTSPCQLSPEVRDALSAGGTLLEVVEPALAGPGGDVTKLRVRAATPVSSPASLLGNGALNAVFSPARAQRLSHACWVGFTPQPSSPPTGVSAFARVHVHFSEPMEASSIENLDSFLLVRGAAAAQSTASPTSLVVGAIASTSSLQQFSIVPTLPLAHVQGVAEPYHVELAGPTDLAGNRLRDELPFADFQLDPQQAAQSNGSIVMRFGDTDELDPIGLPDLRGQFFFDLALGHIRPRPVTFLSWPMDRTNPVPSLMIPFPNGVQSPLVPLGSKLQSVWRYCDLGWSVRDETKYNLDVSGLSWAPVGGHVVADFYPQFEIRLAHSRFLPDEAVDSFLLPKYPLSGLLGKPSPFTDNILVDPLSPQKVVHPRSRGYTVNAADAFVASTGTTMMPYPLNRGAGPLTTYTWRDTAVLAKAGPNGAGIPTDIEAGPPLFLEPAPGTLASTGNVPSIGLPLLLEFRCYPSDFAIGFNALDVSLAVNSSPLPAFRAFSSGGINTAGQPILVNPDTELVPNGGFDPSSTPPGQRTASIDDVVYIGQLDTVTRLSRVHTIWIDTGAANPGYLAPLVAPAPAAQPQGSAVELAFRGATGFSAGALGAPFDGTRIDAYGEIATGTVNFLNGVGTWTDDITTLSGARYLQVRMTFVGDTATFATAELTALGVPFLVH